MIRSVRLFKGLNDVPVIIVGGTLFAVLLLVPFKVFILVVRVLVPVLAVALGVKETPAAAFKEPVRVVNNGLHDLAPVERLYAFCVLDVAGVQPLLK